MTKLHSKKLIAAFQIAIGREKREAAEAAEVTPQTISQWLKEPAFEAKVNEYQLECLEEAQSKLKHLAGDAVSTLETILKNSKSDKSRLEAAKYILDRLQVIPDKCPAILTIGETTEEEIVYRRKMAKVKETQKRALEESSVGVLSSYY